MVQLDGRSLSNSRNNINVKHHEIKVVESADDINSELNSDEPLRLRLNNLKKLKKCFKRRALTAINRVGAARLDPIVITMMYYGKGINIPFDTRVFEDKDQIVIYQQHCGGENLLVFSGSIRQGGKIQFKNKINYTFNTDIFN